jgi:hypothetical protein
MHAVETSLFEFPELPGQWEILGFPGVRAHATPQISHPIGNTVGVAATLSEHRGHGIYTAMMAARLASARAMGKDAAVLQGDRKTSAPIAAKLGFEEICSIDFYRWSSI